VYIAKMPKADIIKQYYTRCGYEMAGSNFIVKVNEPQTITSFEDLADKMLKSTAWVQLVVCHGDPTLGLLLPLVKGAPYNKSGAVINDLAELAARHTDMVNKDKALDGRIKNVMGLMGVKRDALQRLVGKLSDLKRNKFMKNIVEIRGCHLAEGGGPLMQDYRKALGTHMLSAPNCRQLYVPINPDNPAKLSWRAKMYLGKNTTMQALNDSQPPRSRTRRRVFGKMGSTNPEPIIIDIQDVDGHTNVSSYSFMDKPSNASSLAPNFIKNWNQAKKGANNDKFVLPILFDDYESSYHVPLEGGYLSKLKTVTY
jgi:hypothetical protein